MFDFIVNLKKKERNEKFVYEIRTMLEYHRRRGHQLIMSSEHFTSLLGSGKTYKNVWKLLSSLLGEFQVKIVVGYRHFFEWLPSYYYQQHQDPKYLEWRDHGGLHHPSFQEYLDNYLYQWEQRGRNNDTHTREGTHQSLWTFHLWKKHFSNTEIFYLNQKGDTLTNFVCNMLPTAKHTCSLLRRYVEKNGVTVVKRASSTFHAQRLAEAAYHNGMLKKETAKLVSVHVAKYMMSRTKLFSDQQYWTCLHPLQEERFQNESRLFMELVYMADGKEVLTEDWEVARKNHSALFQESKSIGKFCDIDPVPILENVTLMQEIFGKFYDAPNSSN
jgi:hypothetical protein